MPHKIIVKPRGVIGTDVFTIQTAISLFAVDYNNNFLIVKWAENFSADCLITCYKFAEYRLPKKITSDTGLHAYMPQAGISKKFRDFLQEAEDQASNITITPASKQLTSGSMHKVCQMDNEEIYWYYTNISLALLQIRLLPGDPGFWVPPHYCLTDQLEDSFWE